MRNTISGCLIVKNEENHIKRCLESIRYIVDEIIVVDTGSNDKTVEIAESMGAKVYLYQWKNDFSEARNVSTEKATMDWILFIDADEELKHGDGEKIKYIIDDSDYEGFYIKVINIIQKKAVYEAPSVRLYRNNPQYRFRGKLHEQIIHSIKEVSGAECIKETDIVFYHYGYDEKQSNLEQKNKRNIEILESYEKKDKDSYYYFVVGNEYGKIDEGRKALESYMKSVDNMDLDKYQYAYYPSLVMNIVKILNNEKRYIDMISFIKKVEPTTPNYRDLYFMECLGWMQIGKFSRAKDSLNKFINCKVEQNYDYPLNHFETQYDINLIKNKLDKLSITKKEDTLSILIIVDNIHENIVNNLIESIKSINEISENIVIVINEDILINIEMILNVRAQVIQVPKEISNKKISIGRDACNCKYIMIMECGQLSSLELNEKIIYMLENNKIDKIKDMNGMGMTIVKNDHLLFKFDEHASYLENFGKDKIKKIK